MDRTEYLLICLIEECSEVQKAATKALRFGLTDKYKDRGTPLEQLCTEITDVISVIKMLQDESVLLEVGKEKDIQAKIDKINYYMEYSKNRNILT